MLLAVKWDIYFSTERASAYQSLRMYFFLQSDIAVTFIGVYGR